MKIDLNTSSNALMQRLAQAAKQSPTLDDSGAGARLALSANQQLPNPAVVCHVGDDGSAQLPTYAPATMQLWRFEREAYERDEQQMRALFMGGFGASAAEMRTVYDDVIPALTPELMTKDWGFSIRNESLVITEGNDRLTAREARTLQNMLRNLEPAANQLASDVIRYLELDRGTDGVSELLGRYDVSQQNFADIIDMRELLLSHGPDARYGRGYRNPSDYHGLYGMTTSYALADQITARAQPVFMATQRQHDYMTRIS